MPRLRWRKDRLVAWGGLAVLAFLVGLYYVIQRGRLGDARLASDKALLALLTVAIVILVFALAGTLVKNLATLIANRRQGLLGARLQARVTFAFLVLVLIPSLTLFIASITIVKRSLEDLSTTNQARTVQGAVDVAEILDRGAEKTARHFSAQLARDWAEGPLAHAPLAAGEAVDRFLEQARVRYGVAAVGIFPEQGAPVAVASVPGSGPEMVRPSELNRLPPAFAAQVFKNGREGLLSDRMAYGLRIIGATMVEGLAPARAFAWVAVYVPETTAQRLGLLREARKLNEATSKRRPSVEKLYIALFVLLTLVVLVAAVWAATLIARQVTGPILDLASGTEALANGDLSYRVRELGDDEIGRLAHSFNIMAREIERSRADIERRRRYIETLLESVPVGVLSLGAKGRVTTANRAALEALRLDPPPSDIDVVEFLGPAREGLARLLAPVLSGETGRVHGELTIALKEGLVSLMVTAWRFSVGGRREEGILVLLEDLTRLRRAERLAAWGEVARRLAHEIKNPLTPIRLSAERMLRRFRRGDPEFSPVIEEGVGTIVREVESIERLVKEFSRFARLPEIRPRLGSVHKAIEDALALYRSSHSGVDFELDLAPRLPPHRIDPEAIRRCLINLLDNAVAVIGPEGKITIRTRVEGESVIRLEVADNGPGVPAEDRPRLFQPTFSRRPGGTGLGLAIVEQIVLEHGGRIRVEDNPGGGTCLVIELPAAEGLVPPVEQQPEENS